MTPLRYWRVGEGRIGLMALRSPATPTARVVCFPFGGGSPAAFKPLAEALPESTAVIAVDPPGRLRTAGTPHDRIDALVDDYVEFLPPELLDGAVLLGHSVGAYVALSLAARLEREGRNVAGVVAGAAVPPGYLPAERPLTRMSHDELFAWCRKLGTLPGGEQEQRELFSAFGDVIHKDCVAYEGAADVELRHSFPMLVVGGGIDALCPLDQLLAWQGTHPQARVRVLEGGHMFLLDSPDLYAQLVESFLASLRPGARPLEGGWSSAVLPSPLGLDRVLPVLLPEVDEVEGGGAALAARLRSERSVLKELLLTHGAVLARGFAITSPEDLAALVASDDAPVLDYVGGNSPRTRLNQKVYTSTEYPADQDISPHNELSYSSRWPARLFFACPVPAQRGGATPLVDGRAVLQQLPAAVVREFERRGVRYLRALHAGGGPGKSWQATFETDDRAEVERALEEAGAAYSWQPDGSLRVSETRAAMIVHPSTGELSWFNQAEQWHSSSLPKDVRELMLEEYGLEGMPHEATFGDGAPIPDEVVQAVRDVLWGCATRHDWQRGDVLIVENLLTAHARTAFVGPRTVLVAMSGTGSFPTDVEHGVA